jgi:chemotaxis response regulator CheB
MTPIRLLVVDDSLTIRAMLSELFGKQPDMLLVGVASNGEEALQLACQICPNVVTLDVAMPGMDGIALLDRFMHGFRLQAVTLSSRQDLATEAIEHGAVGFFEKANIMRNPAALYRLIRKAALIRPATVREKE